MVEILLATYNGEKYISEQLDSIMNQSYQDFVVIVRDDGSSDNTVSIIKDYIGRYPEKIRLIEDNKNNKVTPMVYSTIRGYDCFGVITIPSLGIELPILNTWDYERLDIGPCIYYGNINENNLVICGHSYKSHFKYLYNLEINDYVIITDVNNNQYIYQVKDMNVINPKDTDEVIENDFDLTLFTCYNSGSQRIVIHLNKVN